MDSVHTNIKRKGCNDGATLTNQTTLFYLMLLIPCCEDLDESVLTDVQDAKYPQNRYAAFKLNSLCLISA